MCLNCGSDLEEKYECEICGKKLCRNCACCTHEGIFLCEGCYDKNICPDDCPYLKPKEREQLSTVVDYHKCLRYDKRVTHRGHHPKLVKLEECSMSRQKDTNVFNSVRVFDRIGDNRFLLLSGEGKLVILKEPVEMKYSFEKLREMANRVIAKQNTIVLNCIMDLYSKLMIPKDYKFHDEVVKAFEAGYSTVYIEV